MPTQVQIAEHLGLSQPAVSGMLARLEIDHQAASLDEIRLAYIQHLRAIAAGHAAQNGSNLAAERAATERVTREIKLLELAEKRGALVNVAQLEEGYARLVDAFREAILALPDKVGNDIKTLHGIEVDVELINEHVCNALAELSGHEPGSGGIPLPAGDTDTASRADVDDVLGDAVSVPVG